MKNESINLVYSLTQPVRVISSTPDLQVLSPEDYQHSSVVFDENTLLFPVKGDLGIRHGKVHHEVRRNEIGFVRKGIAIQFQSRGELAGSCQFLLVPVPAPLMREFAKMIRLPAGARVEPQSVKVHTPGDYLKELFRLIHSYLANGGRMDSTLTRIKLLEVLFHLAENETEVFAQLLCLRERFLPDIVPIVEENIMNSLSINDLAKLCGRSRSSFRRDFHAIFNMSPSQWIRERRLEKARELLRCTTMTITDICFSLGFENIAHFSRLFKSRFDCPPSAYRLTQHRSMDAPSAEERPRPPFQSGRSAVSPEPRNSSGRASR